MLSSLFGPWGTCCFSFLPPFSSRPAFVNSSPASSSSHAYSESGLDSDWEQCNTCSAHVRSAGTGMALRSSISLPATCWRSTWNGEGMGIPKVAMWYPFPVACPAKSISGHSSVSDTRSPPLAPHGPTGQRGLHESCILIVTRIRTDWRTLLVPHMYRPAQAAMVRRFGIARAPTPLTFARVASCFEPGYQAIVMRWLSSFDLVRLVRSS